MKSSSTSSNTPVPLEGTLCILGYEVPIDGDMLEEAGVSGSTALDELFDCHVSYSTALLSCVPGFFQGQVDFSLVIEHILGTLYKHPNHWSELKKTLATDEGYVTIYICPLSGVPMIIPSESVYKIHVNGMTIHMKGPGLSRLSKLTHQNIDPAASGRSLEYLRETGFIGELIEDMDEFITYLFAFVGGSGDDNFVEFMQELLYSGEVYLEIDLAEGDMLIDTSLAGDLDDEENVHDLLDEDEILSQHEEFLDAEVDLDEEMEAFEDTEEQSAFFVKREDLKNPNSIFLNGTNTVH